MSSHFGTLFQVSTFGESHCKGVGVVVDGCPPGLALTEADIQPQLDRRRPGQSALSTDRQEGDRVVIISGTEHGRTLGTPIALQVANRDQRPGDYGEMADIPRPSHADYTYQRKYGISIVAWVSSVGEFSAAPLDMQSLDRKMVDQNLVRCPDQDIALMMERFIATMKNEGDSVGGVVSCFIRGVPAGLGEPTYEKFEAKLAQAMLAIPATKGFEIGSGFAGSRLRGSQHNDLFVKKGTGLATLTNNSGGVQGGISNGEPIIFRVAFKPPATIALPQKTVNFAGEEVVLTAKGRHDPCVVPRAVPIVESMAALVVIDLALRQESRLALMF